jgi:hypothetical protein
MWLEMGSPAGLKFIPLPPRSEKPIFVYGTSISKGGCASRPGIAWNFILSGRPELPVVKMSFAGNGRLDEEVTGFWMKLMPEHIPQILKKLDNYPRIIK